MIHNIILRGRDIQITILEPTQGFGTVRYVNGDNVEYIFTIKSIIQKKGIQDLEVQYSKEIGLVGRDDLRTVSSERYLDSQALVLLEDFDMQNGGTQSPRVWIIKHMINGLVSRLEDFFGDEQNRRGTGHEPFLLDGTPVQPVVLDPSTIEGSAPSYTVTANVVNVAAGTVNYTLRDDGDQTLDQNTTGIFTGVTAGNYSILVTGSDGASAIDQLTVV